MREGTTQAAPDATGIDAASLGDLRQLLAKYDKPGPRYTSYPTAPVWTEAFGEPEYRQALGRVAARDVALYVHVPYCEKLCTYCACNRVITKNHAVAGPYLDAIEREAGLLAKALGGPCRSVQLAIGGGTPTFLSASELERLCDILDAHFSPSDGAERSVEVDPRVTRADQLERLAARGFDRISLGVQDTAPRVQEAIRRIQPAEQTRRIQQAALAAGFAAANFDLIYGLPFQTEASFDATLDEVIAMRPDRIALYSYAHVTWVSKQQRGFDRTDLPSAERKVAIFLLALRRLVDAGYRYIGLDHFALPDDPLARAAESGALHRNFMGYTTQRAESLLALGPSGIAGLPDAYAQSRREPAAWRAALDAGRLPTLRGWRMSGADLRRRFLIQALMCRGAIEPDAYQGEFGEPIEREIPDLHERLAPFVDDGLLATDANGWRVSPLGRLLARPIAMAFDAHLDRMQADRPAFSRTV